MRHLVIFLVLVGFVTWMSVFSNALADSDPNDDYLKFPLDGFYIYADNKHITDILFYRNGESLPHGTITLDEKTNSDINIMIPKNIPRMVNIDFDSSMAVFYTDTLVVPIKEIETDCFYHLRIPVNNADKINIDTISVATGRWEPVKIDDLKCERIYKHYFETYELKSETSHSKIDPLKQIQSGITFNEIQCKENLILIQKYDGSPACVTESTKQKLIERGWTEKIIDIISSKHADVEKLLIENKIDYIPDKLVITTGATIRGDPACGAVVDTDSKVHWFGIDSISNPREMTLYDENPNQCVVNTSSCFCNVQIELSALTLDELDYFTPQEQDKYANILIGYLYEKNVNRTPKFMIGKHNVNYTDPSAIGYCGKIWGTATRGYFSGAIVDGEVKDYGIDKELPLLCAISDDAPYFGKAFGE